MKSERHRKILEIINKNDIETQEELAAALIDAGFNVTQATVSRDIKMLNLTKMVVNGHKKYVVFKNDNNNMNDKYIRVLRDGFSDMDMAQNILVIKTVPGMAMAVCAALDAIDYQEIVGTIAGDDTIMCAVRSVEDTKKLMEKLKNIDTQFINSGVAGDTIAEMGARLAYDVFPYKPDIIIMQGGANDFLMSLYPGARALAERLIRLARRIRQQLPDTKIYIESMYPAYTKRIGLMPSWAEGKSNKEIQKINTEIQRLCKQDNFEYVDVFDKLIGEDGQLSREYTVDGIHLQENAYDVVAAIIYHLMEG